MSDQVVSMEGRQDLSDRIWRELTKDTPANLSIVGPRFIGKTVLLLDLVQKVKREESPYAFVIYWDLANTPPQSDNEFIVQLCDLLIDEMGREGTLADDRAELMEDRSYDVLKEVMRELQQAGKTILMVWDGFDKPLTQGRLTANFFGNLRELFSAKSHRLVIATRKLQTELARSIEIEDSPFWDMFGIDSVRVAPFDSSDLVAVLAATSLNVSSGGQKEILNWSGGRPQMLLKIVRALEDRPEKEIDNDCVNEVAKGIAFKLADFMDKLWDHCEVGVRGLMQTLVVEGELPRRGLNRDDVKILETHGYARVATNKLKPSCKMFSEHVKKFASDASVVKRMFGEWGQYRANIRHVLEMRINQIKTVNPRLHRLVKKCIADIPEFPDDCLNGLSHIEDLALDEVWKCEFGETKTIPEDVVKYWTEYPRCNNFIVKGRIRKGDWKLPPKRIDQLQIMQHLTGSAEEFESKAKHVTKDSYVLLKAIHGFRNRSEHTGDQPIPVGVAVSAVLLCIELLSCFEREIAPN